MSLSASASASAAGSNAVRWCGCSSIVTLRRLTMPYPRKPGAPVQSLRFVWECAAWFNPVHECPSSPDEKRLYIPVEVPCLCEARRRDSTSNFVPANGLIAAMTCDSLPARTARLDERRYFTSRSPWASSNLRMSPATCPKRIFPYTPTAIAASAKRYANFSPREVNNSPKDASTMTASSAMPPKQATCRRFPAFRHPLREVHARFRRRF